MYHQLAKLKQAAASVLRSLIRAPLRGAVCWGRVTGGAGPPPATNFHPFGVRRGGGGREGFGGYFPLNILNNFVIGS